MDSMLEIRETTAPVESGQKYINLKEVYNLFHDLPLEIAMFDI